MNLKEKYDVVVIGAGVGGLTAGAMLGKAGFSVCVLEKEPHEGGYLAGYSKKKFRFDTAIHWLNQCAPGGWVHRTFQAIGTDHPQPVGQTNIRRYKGESFDYLRSPGFDTWRREAPAMLDSLLEAGYPEAAVYRMMANDGLMGGPLANLLRSDPVQDRAYDELFILLNEDSDIAAMLRMRHPSEADSLVTAQARQQAERWHQENFRGRTFDFTARDAESEVGLPLMRAHGQNCSLPAGTASP